MSILTVKMSTFLGEKECSLRRDEIPRFLRKVRMNMRKKTKFIIKEFHEADNSMLKGKKTLQIMEEILSKFWETFPPSEDGNHRRMSSSELSAVRDTVEKLRVQCNALKGTQRRTTNLIAYITKLQEQYHLNYTKCTDLHKKMWSILVTHRGKSPLREKEIDISFSMMDLRRKSKLIDDMYTGIKTKSEYWDEIIKKMEGLLKRMDGWSEQNSLIPYNERNLQSGTLNSTASIFMSPLIHQSVLPLLKQQLSSALSQMLRHELSGRVSPAIVQRLRPIIDNSVELVYHRIIERECLQLRGYGRQ